MSTKIKRMANDILTINEPTMEIKEKQVSIKQADKITNLFYKEFFKNKVDEKIDLCDLKINYQISDKYKNFKADAKVGTNKALITLPNENNQRMIISLTHEKAHVYQKMNNILYNEFVPSFFEILHATILDKENKGILSQNINYNVKCAKEAARKYLLYEVMYSDEEIGYYVEYMFDFYRSINLLDAYFDKNKKDLVIELLQENLFGNLKNKELINMLYLDKDIEDINKKTNRLKIN